MNQPARADFVLREGKKIYKAFKYRLYPNKKQVAKLNNVLEICCYVYNHFLAEKKDEQENINALPHPPIGKIKRIDRCQQSRSLPEMKKKNNWIDVVPSQALVNITFRIDRAFQAFFRRLKDSKNAEKKSDKKSKNKFGYPKFHKKKEYDSYETQQGYKIIPTETRLQILRLSKIGDVKIRLHRPIEGEIKTLTVRRKNNKWFACFTVKTEQKQYPKTDKECGIDVGLEKFITTSDGKEVENPRFYRNSLPKLKYQQRIISRRKKKYNRNEKFSNRLEKANRFLSSQHEHVANQRKDFAHKTADNLLNQYDMIAAENLNVKGMLKNKYLALSISDVGWSQFLSILKNKAKERGKEVILVDPKNTSQICSGCGTIVKKPLSQRQHKCPECGLDIDRDLNAAKNILVRANKQV